MSERKQPSGRRSGDHDDLTTPQQASSGRFDPTGVGNLDDVLGGGLEFEIDQLFVVRRGDCLHLQSDRPHRWRNTGTAPAKALWVALPAR